MKKRRFKATQMTHSDKLPAARSTRMTTAGSAELVMSAAQKAAPTKRLHSQHRHFTATTSATRTKSSPKPSPITTRTSTSPAGDQLPLTTKLSTFNHKDRRERRASRGGLLSPFRTKSSSSSTSSTSSSSPATHLTLDRGGFSSRRAFVIALFLQIVIVSLILHKFPPASASLLVGATGAASDSALAQKRFGTTTPRNENNPHNLNQRPPVALIEPADKRHNGAIDTATADATRQQIDATPPSRVGGARATPHQTSEQQTKETATMMMMMMAMMADAAEDENNARPVNQRAPISFINGEIMNASDKGNKQQSATSSRVGETQHAGNKLEGRQAARPNGRTKRHMEQPLQPLADAEPAAVANQQRQLPAGLDCNKLAALWLYLQSSYPLLASHLVELAGGLGAGKQPPVRATQSARSIGDLLDEAERVMAAVAGKQHAPLGKQPARHRHGPGWLARVSANPTYGKLVQHLRSKQRQMNHQTQHHHQPPTTTTATPAENLIEGANEQLAKLTDDTDGEQVAAASQPTQEVYGRVIHHPHETSRTDNSRGVARTLGKLRLLNQHSRQQQEQLSNGDMLETNRIPPAPDADQMNGADWHKLSESASDLARNNFVYGTVLLRPTGQRDEQGQSNQQRPQHQSSIDTLRELANEQERQRLMLWHKTPESTSNSPDDRSDTVQTSPPSDVSIEDNDKMSNNVRRLASDDPNSVPGSGFQMSSGGGSGGGGGDGTFTQDELTKQQRSEQVALDGAGGGGELVQEANNDEFEGEFHSGPLEKAEVRLLRSLDDNNQPKRQSAAGIPIYGESLTQPLVELATKRAEIVID